MRRTWKVRPPSVVTQCTLPPPLMKTRRGSASEGNMPMTPLAYGASSVSESSSWSITLLNVRPSSPLRYSVFFFVMISTTCPVSQTMSLTAASSSTRDTRNPSCWHDTGASPLPFTATAARTPSRSTACPRPPRTRHCILPPRPPST